ncbi:hypothetical protein KKH56_07500 [bacterium]|nr:hypothetical protein [bacterium]
MKIKKIWLLVGIVFLSANGYCGLQYEAELARKFCPSLQLHSRDQGVAPKSVHIMSNGRAERPVTIAGIQESGHIFRPDLLGIERDMSPNAVFYSESFGYKQEFGSDQSKEKRTRKGRITGTLVGTGIGGGLGYLLYRSIPTGLGGGDTPIGFIIAPVVIGGIIGYEIGNYYDKG